MVLVEQTQPKYVISNYIIQTAITTREAKSKRKKIIFSNKKKRRLAK
jgi:hypothetical protein